MANLSWAYLSGSNLSGAYLCWAYLCGANLSRAKLSGATLGGAYDVIDAGYPDTWRCVAWRKRKDVIQLRVGCRDKTMAEAREYWRDKPDRREVWAALDYIEAVARIRGWIE